MSQQANTPIPRGIEVLVKKAAVDARFRELLLATRAEAADEIGLELDPAEAMMLKAVPEEQLKSIIARTNVDPTIRPAFLARSAAMMLVALGAVALSGCERAPVEKGIRPNPPPKDQRQPERPDRLPQSTGDRPDRPEAAPTAAPATDTSDAEPPKPDSDGITRGIRPDRPEKLSVGGVRPD